MATGTIQSDQEITLLIPLFPDEPLQETLASLDTLGAHCQREVLEEAGRIRLAKEREPIQTVKEYVAHALEGEYSALDSRYYECRPQLSPNILEAYLQANLDDFIEWT